jgi:hypothetical protein
MTNESGIMPFLRPHVEKSSPLPSVSLRKKSEHIERDRESEKRFANVSFINRNEERVV